MVMVNRGRRGLLSRFGLLLTVALVIILVVSGCKSSSGTSTTPSSSTASQTATTSGPLSEQQAIQDLLNNVIKPSSLTHDEIAFTLSQPLAAGSQVAAYAPDPLPAGVTSLPDLVPQTLTATSWFFWVDDDPIAAFSHSSRFVFINATSGAVTVSDQGWWPYINGQAVQQWEGYPDRWNPNNWAYSNVPQSELPDTSVSVPAASQLAFLKPAPGSTPALNGVPTGEAIVPVNGWAPGDVDCGFNIDTQLETQFGQSSGIPSYPPAHTGLQGIQDAVTAAVKGGATDILLYWTGHGGHSTNGSSYLDFKGTPVSPADLTNIFQNFPKVTFKIFIFACYSGGFADAMQSCTNVAFFLASSAANETSWGWASKGDSMSPAFWADLTNVLNTPSLQAEAISDAAVWGQPVFVGWLIIARRSALQDDTFAQSGVTHPVSFVAEGPTTSTTTPPTTTIVTPPPTTTLYIQPTIATSTPPTTTTTTPTTTAPKTYTLTYAAGANGSITGSSPQTVTSGSSGTSVTAVPSIGYYFVSWSDGVLTASRTDTNVTSNISVTASFALAPVFEYTFTDNGNYTSTIILNVTNMQPGWTVTANFSGPGGTNTQTSTYTGSGGKCTWTVSIPGIYKVTAIVTDSTGIIVGNTYTGSENVT